MIRELAPLSIADLFDAFLRIFFNKEALRLTLIYFFIALLTFVPILLFFSQTFFTFIESFAPAVDFNQLGFGDLADVFPWWLVLICAAANLFVSGLYTFVSSELFGCRFFERPFSFSRTFTFHLRRVPAYIVYLLFSTTHSLALYPVFSLISALAAVFTIAFPGPEGFILSFVASVVFVTAAMEASSVFFKGILPAMAFDRFGFFRSIGRSVSLFTRDYFRLFAASLLFRVLIFLGACLLALLFLFAGFFLMSALHLKQERIFIVILTALFAFLGLVSFMTNVAGTAFNVVLYCNQKVKREALGVELLVRGLLEENAVRGEAS